MNHLAEMASTFTSSTKSSRPIDIWMAVHMQESRFCEGYVDFFWLGMAKIACEACSGKREGVCSAPRLSVPPFAASLRSSTVNLNFAIKLSVMGKLTAGEKKRRKRGKAAESHLHKIKEDLKHQEVQSYKEQRQQYHQQRKDTRKKGIRAVLKRNCLPR
ncbi:hypothetical protein G7K_2285-t1 [Saitoella complicata NRRL Y-17804]|uniref:Uncharacterized protein n=1 Tax=Saitoella complicata (strain BCRC 22490 / CBS 7301 / JCM 7358 / NBRC 10748 / NRRL Y-17804) TaxID=698492 RepID=A0A0E9NE65_SAICN|nr:hypothetical protein G7K_2285-t1 [Saitoella complicata NRRL Y-17804]